ncbi:MAG: YigZ family protein [Massiliimalia sp.]
MEQQYKTIAAYAEDEFIERKSRFIGSIQPCSSEEEALRFIEEKRKQYWDATHNVFAYIIRQPGSSEIKRSSDDGEPQGTAGHPVLDVLEKEGLTDVCVVATRYFGGIMLGAGGLVRAYSHTSKIAVDAAQILNMCICKLLRLQFDYTLYGKISYILPDYNIRVESSDFGEFVTMDLLIRGDRAEAFQKALIELTNGKVNAVEILEKYENML